ncbi:amino acid permease/ SLC12A domain-containing protein, partial [Coniella lustricola]
RQFVLIAISGSIGAGLFIASGDALQRGGPGSLVLAFAIVGLAVWLTMCSLGELASTIPTRGSFYDYSVRFISESWGFAMGWNYVVNFMLLVGFEITVIVRLARFWTAGEGPSIVSSGLISVVPACLVLLAALQCFGPRWYGEAEHLFGLLKLGVLTVFVGTAVVIAAGGTEEAGGRGFENYLHNQAFRNSFPGFISVLAAAGLAYGGTEMLGLTAASTSIAPRTSTSTTTTTTTVNPTRQTLLMPLGAKLVALRILLCYCLSLFMLGLVLHPSVLDQPHIASLTASPFVIAVQSAGIAYLPSIINAVLIASVFSMANAAVFASSRALVAICERGMGPRFLVGGNYVPWPALAIVLAVSMLAWLAAVHNGTEVFEWLLALASVSNMLTWASINICHIRFRRALRLQAQAQAASSSSSNLISSTNSTRPLVNFRTTIPTTSTHATTPQALLFIRGILGFVVVALFYFGHLGW